MPGEFVTTKKNVEKLVVADMRRSYDTFRAIANTTDIDAPSRDAEAALSSAPSRATARRLRRTRQRLGSYRHDLVVAMRVVNSVEREVLQSEWENWLADENVRCEQVEAMLDVDDKDDAEGSEDGEKKKKKDGGVGEAQKTLRPVDKKRIGALREWHRRYCGSCRADQQAVLEERSRMPLV